MELNFCRMVDLDGTYENVLSFKDIESKYRYFKNKVLLKKEVNAKPDTIISEITVDMTLYETEKYDFLFFKNETRYNYFFIVGREYVTSSKTRIFIDLDVWSTYYGEWFFNDSFVDRMHSPRWEGDTPVINTEDEGLDYGEIIQIGDKEEIADFSDSVIIASSVPLGVLPNTPSGGGGDVCWEEGKPSPKGFRFIKGFEGFAPYEYQDSGGYWTIAYGVTKHGEPDIYADLASQQPVTEEVGAKVSYDLKVKRYGLPILDSFKALGCNNQNQFDALLSLAYNSGNGSVTGSNSLTNAIKQNPNDEATIRPIWEKFKITSGGKPLAGLIARRKQECNLYFGQTVEIRDIGLLDRNGNIVGKVTENDGNGWLPPECESGGGDYNGYKSFDNEFGQGWLCPVKGGTVTSKYGWRINPITGEKQFHHGTDIGVPLDTDYIASKDGVVVQQGYSQSMGNYIYIVHDNKYVTRVMHLNKILTQQGQQVSRGEIIGKAGTTGSSTGVHAHWEIRTWNDGNYGDSTDPAPQLQKGDKV